MDRAPRRYLPAEWHPQAAILLTWPHPDSDWADQLPAVEACFLQLAQAILDHQDLWISCPSVDQFYTQFPQLRSERLRLFALPSNDTWARDHAALTVLEDGQPVLLDFQFNGWGLQFPADRDNRLTRRWWSQYARSGLRYESHLHFVLEGGSIESDGQGTLLTTAECLLSPNRNPGYSRGAIADYLCDALGAERLLWLENGALLGDDTGGHIDTLARFCDPQTIAYVQCTDPTDAHYEGLAAMEAELQSFRRS